ncbi:DUF6884 domain-containing protein [Natronocalculus amylovorans]|uniref:DUF6884 domain-containing protein n=1 Tax=Natronocalculus amylovorans TaxID=2917812 RepID=A0AAE3KAJ7_9EURY|nr:DUF6884 domain-containing protein [Natronocalculus amylovorans]MCL9818365.1 hypothetical protein [Natronocalculus amylovorans]
MSDDFKKDSVQLVIVGCGSAKQSETVPAKELYTSTYFVKKRKYAEVCGDFWTILSAEHGLIEPTVEIEPYDTTIADLSKNDLDELAHSVGMELIDWIVDLRTKGAVVDEIVVLAGRSYLNPLKKREAFSAGINARVLYPFQESNLGGIGEQMAWLSERVHSTKTKQQRLDTKGDQCE